MSKFGGLFARKAGLYDNTAAPTPTNTTPPDNPLELDEELSLADVTPELYQALQMLEPYGMSNPEPLFATRGAQLVAPPKILKEKHLKLKLRAGRLPRSEESPELSAAAILATPDCHPDGATIRRNERAAAVAEVQAGLPRTENRHDFRSRITFDALGWHMAERLQQSPLLAGDSVDIAFTIGQNDHPEYGGIELSLRDLKSCITTSGNAHPAVPSPP